MARNSDQIKRNKTLNYICRNNLLNFILKFLMLDRSLKLKDKMGCPYCYLASRLRSPCPCTYYQTAGLLNLPLSPIFPVSRNIEDDSTTTGRETENTRVREWELGMRGTRSLNEFDSFSQLPIPYFYLRYPVSPIVYFGGKVLPQFSTAEDFKVASSEHTSPARAQLRPEMAAPLSVENKNSHIEEQRKDACHDSVKTAEKSATKTQSHENAWGGPTYTELITEAILSSPENRMTLSQIYNWITENVEYFRERKNNTSARGWKNAVRHTLSLRKRFKRVARTNGAASWYNSWWMINENQMTRRRGKTKPRLSSYTSTN